MPFESTHFFTPEICKSMLKATPLDSSNRITQRLIKQGELLSKWTGVDVELVGTKEDPSCTCGSSIVGVDLAQLSDLFAGFEGDQLDTALFFALAHEYGHIVQYIHTPEVDCECFSRTLREAHADILGGVWMGIRLHEREPRLPEYLRETGLRLKQGQSNYPSPYQRACIIERGMADSLLIAEHLDPKITDPNYTPIKKALTDQDVRDLLVTAKAVLDSTPEEEPIAAAVAAIEGLIGDFCLKDFRDACPGVGVEVFHKVLARLEEEGRIKSLSSGRAAQWRKIER